MKISGKVLRGLIREELKRSLTESVGNWGYSQFIYPADMIVGMEPARRAAQDVARGELFKSAMALGVSEMQALWAAGQGKGAMAWTQASKRMGSPAPVEGTPLETLSAEQIVGLWEAVKEAYEVLASQGG
jgi:hypothetical protein